jgi:hypothetical protein
VDVKGGHISFKEEVRNSYKILIGKSEGKV